MDFGADLKQRDAAYIANTYGRFDLCLTKGSGSLLYDEKGNEYIDMGTGIAVNAFGMGDEAWKAAVVDQMETLGHTSNLYFTEPQVRLAEMLCEGTDMARVFFGNSGAEANECAIKVARKYAHDVHHDETPVIITLKGSFHGRTITTLAATGQDVFHKDFGPFTPGFAYVEPGDIEAIEQAIAKEKPCAVLVEIVQGEGGVRALDGGYLRRVEECCHQAGTLFMVDEVQTGNGRTGKLFAYMHHGLAPDVVTTAKGLGGGLPIGACMMSEKVKDVLGAGSHGSTFGGNPLCAAGALSVFSRLTEEFLADVSAKGDYIRSGLAGAPGIRGITGLGLMLGIETERPAREVVARCQEKGVLVLTAKDKVRLLPALNIPMNLLEKAVATIKEAAK